MPRRHAGDKRVRGQGGTSDPGDAVVHVAFRGTRVPLCGQDPVNLWVLHATVKTMAQRLAALPNACPGCVRYWSVWEMDYTGEAVQAGYITRAMLQEEALDIMGEVDDADA